MKPVTIAPSYGPGSVSGVYQVGAFGAAQPHGQNIVGHVRGQHVDHVGAESASRCSGWWCLVGHVRHHAAQRDPLVVVAVRHVSRHKQVMRDDGRG